MQIEFYIPEEKFFGQDIKAYVPEITHRHVVINGFPYDQGTKINGGRIGGSAATAMFRKALNSHEIYKKQGIDVFDSGDITEELPLQQAHEILYQKNLQILKSPESILCVFGGSNDQSFPNARSLIETYPENRIAVINIDAHFDVRPLKQGKAHSGSPFRLLLQYQTFNKNKSIFVEFASKGASCSDVHYKYLKEKECQIVWLQKDIRRHKIIQNQEYHTQGGQMMKILMEKLSKEVDYIFVSFDVDSISSVYMPGVSAPSIIGGLTNIEAQQILDIAGKNSKVKLVDFSQFNPAVQSIRSSRLLVEMFYTFCMASAKRK